MSVDHLSIAVIFAIAEPNLIQVASTMTSMTQKLTGADAKHGYEFGCEGFLSLTEAREFLGGISRQTLNRRVDEGLLRKGKHPGGSGPSRVVICRRSLREYASRMEV